MTLGGSAEVYEIARDVPEVPDGLEPPRGDAGQVVALLADKASRSHGWCGHFALALASRWCGPQRQVVIADGDLERGPLHSIADVPNDEGIGDLLRYGASSKRVIRQLSPAGPHLIPAGTVVCDPEESLRDPRWSFLLDELRGKGTTLLVYLPADSAGAAALAAEAGRDHSHGVRRSRGRSGSRRHLGPRRGPGAASRARLRCIPGRQARPRRTDRPCA